MKKVLVVGAAGGVGSAVAAILAQRGDQVRGTVLNEAEAALARKLVPGLASVDFLDLSKADEVAAATRALLTRDSEVDAVIVCAAISPYGPTETTPLSVARRTFEINCLSGLAIFQAALPALRARRGRIIFISSMAGKTGMPFIGAYTASKYALEGLADVMRREVKSQGVDVILVEPGGIRTGMVEGQLKSIVGDIAALGEDERKRYGDLYRQFQNLAGRSYHEGTASSPESVAAIVVEALDAQKPAARYIAGEDAKELIGLAHRVSDEELDVAFASMFAAALK